MAKKIYVVTDLGPGDGGKGGVVHKIATMKRAHTVIKVGGAQGQHGVCTSKGERFAFSQWGCGTLEGIRTYISPRMVISPEGLLNEGVALKYQCGIRDAFELLTVDQEALCATPYHGIASRLIEMARGNNPRGTIGTGVGVAYRCAQQFPESVIKAKDLSRPDIRDMLEVVRKQQIRNLGGIIGGKFLLSDQEEAKGEISLLYSDDFLNHVASRFCEAAKIVKIVDPDFFRKKILSKDGVAVVESSHGILTDNLYGFHPHTSAIRTLPCFTHAMLDNAGYEGQVINIGVTRAYSIRHGAGPMPTDYPEMAESLLPGSRKVDNRYQGKARVGPLDLVLLRYSIEVCGGPSAFDGLAITWFDQIQKNETWLLGDRYHIIPSSQKYFSSSSAMKVSHRSGSRQIGYQKRLCEKLQMCIPELVSHKIRSDASRDELYGFCNSVLKEKTGVPVRMVSFGPTERDKVCK